MGPIETLITFAEKSKGLKTSVRRKIIFKTVGVATVIGLVFIILGNYIIQLFKINPIALSFV